MVIGRVVASPKPVEIVEQDAINSLVDANKIVICCGGGGIPVVLNGHHLKGASAVIDKDYASCLLAKELDADMLIILTAVEKVAVNFGKENEEWLDDITVDDAKKYINEGQFAPGSMLPKVQAAVDFASSKEGRTAMITLLQKAKDGIQGKTGTKIHLLICSADILLYISCLILIYITATYSGYLPYSEIIAQKSSGDLARNFFCDEWTRVSGKSFLNLHAPLFGIF